jgi:hypothetical protein
MSQIPVSEHEFIHEKGAKDKDVIWLPSPDLLFYLFLLPELNLRLRPRLLELNPGTRIISNSFDLGEWEPDDQILIEYIEKENTGISSTSQLKKVRAFYWIVPGKAEVK